MSEEKQYQAKEEARMSLQGAIQTYKDAATEYGYDNFEMASAGTQG